MGSAESKAEPPKTCTREVQTGITIPPHFVTQQRFWYESEDAQQVALYHWHQSQKQKVCYLTTTSLTYFAIICLPF